MSSAVAALSALLAPVTAGLTLYIAWQQWKTNQNKLKLDLFERRYAVYQAAVDLISAILTTGKSTSAVTAAMVNKTRSANFIVGKKIMTYLDDELYRRAVRLEVLQSEFPITPGQEAQRANVHEQAELKRWFAEQYHVLRTLFAEQLNLGH